MTPSDILITGKSCLITGGASGIGAGIAEAFARFGGRVAIADIDYAAAEKTADLIRKAGGDALAIACDVMDEEQITAAVTSTVEAFGSLDVLVNNAMQSFFR